jgi:hypothetical protein
MPALLFALLSGHAHALEPAILDAYAPEAQGTQIVVLLDASTPSDELKVARQKLADAIEALPDGDRVAVVSVAGKSQLVFPDTVLDSSTRGAAAQAVRSGRLGPGRDSDVAGAATELTKLVQAEPEAPLQVVFWVSPFCPSKTNADASAPPPAEAPLIGLPSPSEEKPVELPKATGNGGACGPLPDLTAANRILSIRRLQGNFVGRVLARTPSDEALQAAHALFGIDSIPAPSSPEVTEDLTALASDPARWKAVQLVKADAAKAHAELAVARVDGSRADIEVDSGLAHLRLRLSELRASGVRATIDTNELVLDPKGIVRADIDLPKSLFVFTGAHKKRNAGLTLSGRGTLEPGDDLKALGIEPEIGEVESSIVVNVDQDLTGQLLFSWLVAIVGLGVVLMGVLAPRALFLMAKNVVLFPLKFIIGDTDGKNAQSDDDGASLVGRLVCYAESGRVTGVNMDGQARMAIKIEVDALSEGDFNDAQFLVMARRDEKTESTVYNLAVRDFGYFVNGVMVEPGTYAVEPGAMKIQGRAWSIVWELG